MEGEKCSMRIFIYFHRYLKLFSDKYVVFHINSLFHDNFFCMENLSSFNIPLTAVYTAFSCSL